MRNSTSLGSLINHWTYFALSGGTSLSHSRSMLPCSSTSRFRKFCI